jgi:PAS domain S-box-containing protein
LGGVDFVFKPFIPDVLRAKVAAFVEMFKQRQEAQRQSALLRAERDFADAILDTVAGFVVVLDTEGRILRVNRTFEEITGYTSEQVEGHSLHEYLEEKDAARQFLREAKGPADCHEYWLANGNARRLISWCCTALDKEIAGRRRLVVTGRDITELRKRTEELEGFTYSVSHDMRAPVRAIDGFTRILIEEYASSLDEEGRRLLDIVRQNTEKMGQLIDGLLALSRLGRERLIFSEIDMTELAKAAFQEQKAEGGRQRNISFKLGELPIAYGDKRLITQVFQNLLANAIKFTRKQSAPIIEVGFQTGANEDTYFVRDNGVGFDMNHAKSCSGRSSDFTLQTNSRAAGSDLPRYSGSSIVTAAAFGQKPNRTGALRFTSPCRSKSIERRPSGASILRSALRVLLHDVAIQLGQIGTDEDAVKAGRTAVFGFFLVRALCPSL